MAVVVVAPPIVVVAGAVVLVAVVVPCCELYTGATVRPIVIACKVPSLCTVVFICLTYVM